MIPSEIIKNKNESLLLAPRHSILGEMVKLQQVNFQKSPLESEVTQMVFLMFLARSIFYIKMTNW